MKTTIQLHDFINCDALNNNFSYEGLVALFEYLEQYEQDCGVELDFDPIAIRCDFTEFGTLDDASHYYTDMFDLENDDEKMEWLQDRTQVILFDTGIILQDF